MLADYLDGQEDELVIEVATRMTMSKRVFQCNPIPTDYDKIMVLEFKSTSIISCTTLTSPLRMARIRETPKITSYFEIKVTSSS